MAKYLNVDQRETVLWIDALTEKLKEDTAYWPAAKRKFIKDFIPLLEDLMIDLMNGINEKEGASIIKMARNVRPVLLRTDFAEVDDKIQVDWEQVYTLAEVGLEFCKASAMFGQINKLTNAKAIKQYIKDNWKCNECKDPDKCPARRVFLHFMIPPLTESGKCQYYRGEG